MNRQELIEQIVREVVRRLESNTPETAQPDKAERRIIVAGDASSLHEEDKAGAKLLALDECRDRDIFDCDCVYIAELSNTQLCDIALGRDNSPLTYAVGKVLLMGKPVVLYETALRYRCYKGTAPPALYAVLEGYLERLLTYGVKLVGEDYKGRPDASGLSDRPGQCDCNEKLITGSIAEQLCKKGKKKCTFAAGTILTPLARDCFRSAKVQVEFLQQNNKGDG